MVSVEEVLAQIRAMGPEDLRKVKAVLQSVEASMEPAEAEAKRRAEAWHSLEWGWGTSGGRALSENIDKALYGGDA